MKLCKISIEGFRSIEKIENLSIGSPTLLTGHNDSGKTSILDSIRFLLGNFSARENDRTYLSSFLQNKADQCETPRVFQTCVEGHFELSKEEQDQLGLESTVLIRRKFDKENTPIFEILSLEPVDERLRSYNQSTISDLKLLTSQLGIAVLGTKKDSYLESLYKYSEKSDKEYTWISASPAIVKCLPKLLYFDSATNNDAEIIIKSALQVAYDSHIAEPELNSKIKSLESDLRVKLAFDATGIKNHIVEICGDIGEVEIEPIINFSSALKSIQIKVTSKEGEGVSIKDSGAGRARRISLAVWEYTQGILSESSTGDIVVLYDEPDTHLDYIRQRELIKILTDQCNLQNVKMVIATHSMSLIDSIDIKDIVHIKLENHRTIVETLVNESEVGSHLGAIASSLGLKNTVLLHERLFVGVEGESEKRSFPILFKTATGRHLESHGIVLWGCGSNNGAMSFAKFLIDNKRSVHFAIDTDSFEEFNNKIQRLDPESPHKKYVSWIGNEEMEDLFTDLQWANLANVHWPRVDSIAWDEKDIKELRNSKKFSGRLYTLFLENSVNVPKGKPEMAMKMAMSIEESSDIPKDLMNIFQDLIQLAK